MSVCQIDRSVIEELLDYPFSSRNLAEKIKIIKDGRPTPPLPNLKSVHKDKKDTYTRNFQVAQYDLYPWLTGCRNLNKLFCWPCLLFSKSESNWNSGGFVNLNNLNTSQKKHKSSATHLQCTLDLLHFGRQNIDEAFDIQLKFNNSEHNKRVKKNREILKRFIDVTCLLAKQEFPSRGHDESYSSPNKDNYFIEVLQLLREYDPLLDEHLEKTTTFEDTASAIQNDLVKAIHAVMLDEISRQILLAPHVAIILDETSDSQMVSQLSTVLRYISDGKIQERFVGFTDVSANRSSDGLFVHVQNIVTRFNLTSKLIAQAYDGASVMSGHLNDLQQKVLDAYPHALHVHCYAHELNLVLSQSLYNIKECGIFFSTLNGIATFASHSAKRTYALAEHLKTKIPSLVATNSRLVNVIEDNRILILDYFESIEEQDEWNTTDKMASTGYKEFLKKFETVFMLKLFSSIFTHSDTLFNVLQTKVLDMISCATKIKEFRNHLLAERDTAFPVLWELSNDGTQPRETKRIKIEGENSPESKYRIIFYEIIDSIVNNLSVRFSGIEKLEFFSLLNCEKFDKYKFKSKFPEPLLQKLNQIYNGIFDCALLKSELVVLYESDDFKEKSPFEILQWFHNNNMIKTFEEAYKLANLVSTIPATIASVEPNSSALKRIKTYLRSTAGQERLSDLSLLSVEKALISDLRKKPNFYDLVIEKFIAMDSRAEFHFR